MSQTLLPIEGVYDRDTGILTGLMSPGGTVQSLSGGSGTVQSVAGHNPDVTGNVNINTADLGDLTSFDLVNGNTAVKNAVASIPTTALALHAVPVSGGSYNASTNTPTRISGTAPADGVQCLTVSVAGTMVIGGVSTSLFVGDEIYWNGVDYTVVRGVPQTTAIKKGDGTGALVDAVANVDFAPANTVLSMNIPWGLPPSGSTIGANGAAFTAATAFLEVYNAPGVYLYFNAGECAAGSAAGFYPVIMSTTTAGTIYNNPVAAGSSHAAFAWPASPTAFTTNAGSTTAGVTNTYVAGPTTALAAGCMGKNGFVDFVLNMRNNNSTGSKTLLPNFGINQAIGVSSTTNVSSAIDCIVGNKGSYSLQVGVVRSYAGGSLAPAAYTNNTNAAFNVGFSVRTVVATDWVIGVYTHIKTEYVA